MLGRDGLRCRPWFKAVQPVKKLHQHFQTILLVTLQPVARIHTSLLCVRVILKFEVPPLERNGVVEKELRSVFEGILDGVRRKVLVERVRDVREKEGNVFGRGLGEDGGQSGKCRVGTNSDPWGGAVGQDENGSDIVGVLLHLSNQAFLGELVLQNTASIGEPRCDRDLSKRLPLLTTFTKAGTYLYEVIAHKFVNAG